MQSIFKNNKQIIIFSFNFFLIIVLLIGCNRKEREKEKVDEFHKIFNNGNYRKVLLDYEKLLANLSDTTAINRAKEIYLDSQYIVDKVDSLILIANKLNDIGYNLKALKYAQEASNLYPNDSLSSTTLLNIPKGKKPKFKIGGTFRSARFEYVFHTIWQKEEIRPVSVDITVTNLTPYSATALAFFVPSFYYLETSSSGPRFLVIVADHYKWSANKQFNKPIYVNKTLTGRVSYAGANITRQNTNMTLEKIFKEIIIGDDSRFFLNIAGTRNTRFSGLAFAGYE